MKHRFAYDYSGSIHPSLIAAGGGEAICRYLGGPNPLTSDEIEAALRAHIAVVAIFETDNDEAEHPERGAADGTELERLAFACQWAYDRPVYVTDDKNNADPDKAVAYCGGVLTTVDLRRDLGIYGNDAVVKAVKAAYPTRFRYGWRVETWGPLSDQAEWDEEDYSPADLVQLANVNPAPIAGADTNLIVNTDYGQWPRPGIQEEDMKVTLVVNSQHPDWGIAVTDGIGIRHVGSPQAIAEWVAAGLVTNITGPDGQLVYPALSDFGWTALMQYDDPGTKSGITPDQLHAELSKLKLTFG